MVRGTGVGGMGARQTGLLAHLATDVVRALEAQRGLGATAGDGALLDAVEAAAAGFGQLRRAEVVFSVHAT
jgi:hypothetical protein